MNVFAKIFAQIFDSSISSDHVVRHVFMDLLVLADRDGVVDMTLDAISRRTNVPEEMVSHAIAELMKPDRKSRSHAEAGARLVALDSHRDWGWQIVNYEHYRNIKDEEARRTYFRDKQRAHRAKSKTPTASQTQSSEVKDNTTQSNKITQGEGDIEEDISLKAKPKGKSAAFSIPGWVDREAWDGFEEMRRKIRAPLTDRARYGIVKELAKLCPMGSSGAEILDQSTQNSWRGVFPLRQQNGVADGRSGKSKPSPAKERIDGARRVLAGIAIKRGLIDPAGFDGGADAPLSESGPGGKRS